jgi:hypothetical protein
MANDYSGYSADNGFAGFNYTNEQAKLARQQAAAQQLQALAMKQSQPSFVQNGMGTFYSGGNGKVGAISQVLAALLANKTNADNDASQKGLDSTSQAALAYNLDPYNAPNVRSAVAAQQADEDAAQLQRELNRYSTPAPVDPSAQPGSDASAPDNAPGVETFPVQPQSPSNATQLPPSDPAPQRAALSPSQVAALSALKPDPNAMPGRSTGNGGPTASELAIWNAKQAGTDPLADFRARELAQAKKNQALANSPFPSVKAPPQPPIVYQTTATQEAAKAAQAAAQPQPQPAPQPTPQVPPPMPAPQAMPAPAAPQPEPEPTPPADPSMYDPRTAKQIAADNAVQSMTPADHIKQLIAISNTGPLGQQIATAQMNQMFGSKNGRYTTDVKADTVNGGFVAVTTDSQTGRITNAVPIGATGSGKLVTGQTTDANGNRFNVHKDGSTSPMLDPSGNRIVDPSVKKANDEFSQRTNEAVAKNKAAIGAIDSTLQRLDTIDALSDQYGGPLNSVVPDKVATAGLRTYRGLIGQDVFSGVRDAVNAGGEGSPRFTQGEFSHFENNGGLNADMKPETVKELTAQQRAALLAKRDALVQYGQSLPMPQANPTPSIPARQPGAPPSQLNYSQFTGGR